MINLDQWARLTVLSVLLVESGIQYYYRIRFHSQRKYEREPREIARTLLFLIFLICLLLWLVRPDLLAIAGFPLPGWIRGAGIVVVVLSLILWAWSQVVLGENWSARVVVRKDHSLTTTGPYRWVRHPMYTSYILLALGVLLGSANLIVGGSLSLYVWLTVSRAVQEEELMTQIFGQDYLDWAQKTGRYLPRL